MVMKKRIEKYLPRAIEIVKEVGIADEDNRVPSEFNGYISSFGAAIIQSGLKPAAAFFSNENSRTEKVRSLVVKAVYALINDNEAEKIEAKDLLDHIIQNNHRIRSITQEIIDASVALKLAIRTYKKLKSDE